MQQSFFIKHNGSYVRIHFKDIIYIESLGNYLKIYCRDRNYLILMTLKGMMEFLPESSFHRIHKSFIISLDYLTEFNNQMVKLGDIQLPVGEINGQGLSRKVNIFKDPKSGTECIISSISQNSFNAIPEKSAYFSFKH